MARHVIKFGNGMFYRSMDALAVRGVSDPGAATLLSYPDALAVRATLARRVQVRVRVRRATYANLAGYQGEVLTYVLT